MTSLLNSGSTLLDKMEVRTRKNALWHGEPNLCKLSFGTNSTRGVQPAYCFVFTREIGLVFTFKRSVLYLFQVFNCLTTFRLTQLTQLKQWSLLHANQPVVPQATPVPGFERLIMLPQIVDQDIPASTKQGKRAKFIS